MRPGQELALLVRVAVDRVVEEVGADAAVVEQRVALARRAVAATLAVVLGLDQELEQLALGLLDLLVEAAVALERRRSPAAISRCAQLGDAVADRLRRSSAWRA